MRQITAWSRFSNPFLFHEIPYLDTTGYAPAFSLYRCWFFRGLWLVGVPHGVPWQ